MNLFLMLAAAALIEATPPPLPPMPMPAFLAGCWEQRSGDRWTEECWTTARGGLMIGSGRAGLADQVQSWEWMRVERGADGGLSFYGSPKGAPPVAFRATEAGPDRITFVNAAHDFPQRVSYVRTTTGIEAEVSLADGSKAMRWSYRRQGSSD
jgi:ABC-type sugar transport system substrate-binding protein